MEKSFQHMKSFGEIGIFFSYFVKFAFKMILILPLTVPFPASFHFSLFNGFVPVELYVNANKGEEQETTLNPRKTKLQSLGLFFSFRTK